MRNDRSVRRVIRSIVKVLGDRYQPERIILFGSYADGTSRADSDIDLLIVKATRRPFFQRLAEVRRLVSEVRRGYAFDPVVVTPSELKRRLARGDQFLQGVVDHGNLLYAGR